MGVSGSGKTTIAALLAERLRYSFADADDMHPPQNVAKMTRGEPLTDADRGPWLASLAAWMHAQHEAGRATVLACSALKRVYRDTLRSAAPDVFFLHLAVPSETLLERLRRRRGHFMPRTLLESQLETLEPLQPGERGVTLDAARPPAAVVSAALERLEQAFQ